MDPCFHEADLMHGIQQATEELVSVLLSLWDELPTQQAKAIHNLAGFHNVDVA
jgi:uncharacterized membrane protein YgcG